MKSMRRVCPAGAGLGVLLALLGIGAAGSLTAGGCRRGPARPDVLLVTIDTLRSDHVSAYGYPVPTTPNIDALAKKGVLYRRAYAESSTTAPSHAVLMTGRHFRSLGVTKNGGTLLPDAVTLAEALRDAGYATAAFVSSFPLMTRFGFSQGFEVYDDNFAREGSSIGRQKLKTPHDRVAGVTRAHLERWLTKHGDDRPLFLWVHFVDPHAPYRAPEKFEATWPEGTSVARQRYDGEVHYADGQLGHVLELLATKRPGRELLTVVTSDHGEGLGDHGWMSHGINLHEEAVRVPLVASWSGHLPNGAVVETPVGLLDIAPGILGLLGIDATTFSHGVSLFGSGDPARSIFLQRRDYKSARDHGRQLGGEMTAVVEGGSKLIVAPSEERRELFDLGADPGELHDLLAGPGKRGAPAAATPTGKAAHEELARKLEGRLSDWKDAFPPAAVPDAPMDKETLKALRSLGYVD